MKLQSFAEERWHVPDGDGKVLSSAVDGSPVATVSSSGLDFSTMHSYARRVGGHNLRQYTFHERAGMLK